MIEVYPRVCGGTAANDDQGLLIPGLSPRVRGNQLKGTGAMFRERSIPACAGEPIVTQPPKFSMRVYPRVCGGTHARRRFSLLAEGLSPRVRGNL